MEQRGLHISRNKTEYLGCNRNENATMIVRNYETEQDKK